MKSFGLELDPSCQSTTWLETLKLELWCFGDFTQVGHFNALLKNAFYDYSGTVRIGRELFDTSILCKITFLIKRQGGML